MRLHNKIAERRRPYVPGIDRCCRSVVGRRLCSGRSTPAAKPAGIERKDYKWNAQDNPEKNKALRLEGNAKAGEADYKAYCEACHLPQGVGNPHGSIPQLAGQHPTVIVKQLADIRSGLRDNATMYPFSHPDMIRVIAKYNDAQLVAIAAYQAMLVTQLRQWSTHPHFCQPS